MALILVVDDSMFARLQITAKLKEGGFDVIEGKNGQEGLEKLQDSQVDCILSDLLMPVMDGFEFLERLKQDGNSIPVLVMSSDIQQSSRDKIMALGAVELINKPPNYTELIEKINTLINKKD